MSGNTGGMLRGVQGSGGRKDMKTFSVLMSVAIPFRCIHLNATATGLC